MKIKQLLIPAVLVFFCVLSPAAQDRNLSWSLALVDSKSQGLSFSRPVPMQNGDVFSLTIAGGAACYVYVIVQDSEHNVLTLHAGPARANEAVSIGPMQVTPPEGSETFYVVVSLNEQTRLQEAINAYAKSGNSRNSRNLINAVMEIRRFVSRLKESPEKPVYMGGAFRGETQTQGTGYSGVDTYVKTLIISH
jgi:hypothetical protein